MKRFLVFINSPIQEGDLTTLQEPSEERQTWFTTTEDNYYTRDHPITGYNKTFEDSSQFFRNFIQENVNSFLSIHLTTRLFRAPSMEFWPSVRDAHSHMHF